MSFLLVQSICAVFGLFFFFTGATSFARPHLFAKKLGLITTGASGVVEIRAQYGGFFIAAGFALWAPLIDLLSFAGAYVVALVIFGGLFLGRICAAVIGGRNDALLPTIRALYLIDGLGAILAATGLYISIRMGLI